MYTITMDVHLMQVLANCMEHISGDISAVKLLMNESAVPVDSCPLDLCVDNSLFTTSSPTSPGPAASLCTPVVNDDDSCSHLEFSFDVDTSILTFTLLTYLVHF